MHILAFEDLWKGIDVGQQLVYFLPEIALTCTMLAIVAAPLLIGRRTKTIAGVAAVGIVVSGLLTIMVASWIRIEGPVSGLVPDPSAGMLIADDMGMFFKLLLIVFLGAVSYLWWMGSSSTERNAPVSAMRWGRVLFVVGRGIGLGVGHGVCLYRTVFVLVGYGFVVVLG